MRLINFHVKTSFRSQLSLMVVISILGIIYFLGYELIEGDPSIYFSFLPHMFSAPFSFGQEGRISFGATSPIFAILLATIYSFTESADEILVIAKIGGAAFMGLALVCMAWCVKLLSANEKLTTHRAIYCVIMPFVLVGTLFYHSVFLFETPLVLLYSSACLLLFLRRRYLWLLVLLPLAYLMRPEVVLLQFVLGLMALWELWKQGKQGLCILLVLLQFLPILCYHWYMFEHTARVIPTSIESRASRTGHDSGLIEFAYAFLSTYHFFTGLLLLTCIIFLGGLGVGGAFERGRSLQLLLYFTVGFPIVLLAISPTLPSRYFDFLMPLLIVFCGHRLATQMDSDRRTQPAAGREQPQELSLVSCFVIVVMAALLLTNEVLLSHGLVVPGIAAALRASLYGLLLGSVVYLCRGVAAKWLHVIAPALIVFVNWHIFSFGPYSLDSKLKNRLDHDFGMQVDDLLKEDEKLVMYEIQLQYGTSRKILSMDGIVGNGEFIDFYKGKESFEEALKRNDVHYIGIDPFGAAPPILRDQGSRLLFDNYRDMEVGESVVGREFKYTKVLENNSDMVYPMWHTIYRVDLL